MECRYPPAMTDDEISALIDGDAADAALEPLRQHAARCESCAARLDEAQQLERFLDHHLRDWDCPTSQQLGDYHTRLLDAPAMEHIARHLDECARCRAELEELRDFVSDLLPDVPFQPTRAPAVQPAGTERRPVTFRELTAVLLSPAPALALRGNVSPRTITAQAGEVTVFLELQQEGTDRRFALRGQLVADDLAEWSRALVEIWQLNVLEATTTVDDMGSFKRKPFQPGLTDIRIRTEFGATLLITNVTLTP